jgi:hypothetical protein
MRGAPTRFSAFLALVACTPVGPRQEPVPENRVAEVEWHHAEDRVEEPIEESTHRWPCMSEPTDHPLPFAGFDAAMADVDGDGHEDLVALGWLARGMVTLAGDGQGGFAELARPAPENEALQIELGDVDGDGHVDLLTFHPRLRSVHVRKGDGSGDFAAGKPIALGRQVYSGLAHDVDGDGDIDLVVTHFRHITVLLGNGRGGFSSRAPVRTGQAPSYPLVADLTKNGKLELALASNDDGGIDIFSIGRGGALARHRHVACGDGPIALVSGDFTGDGRLDLATANMHSHDVCVFIATDKGFVAHQRIEERHDQLAAIDFDRDGRDELVLIGESGVTVYRSTRSGPLALTEIARVQAGHAPRRAFARDLDADGLTDLVLVNGNRPTWSGDTLLNPSHASVTVLMGRACTL